jgi:hypothetical protein
MTLPAIADITRTLGEVYPDVLVTCGADLTGHTAHLVVALANGTVVASIAGSVSAGATSTITATPTAPTVATAYAAGEAEYAVILDVASDAARRTIAAGDWIVVDRPGPA